jgi:NADH-quinone oxidoreductase subunit N
MSWRASCGNDGRSAEAGLKYFVLGALASGILLFGISLLYGFTGSDQLCGHRRKALSGDIGMGELFGLVFVLAGLAFKISAVPFHMWTPDVYEGAPTPVTAFFASAPKVAAMGADRARRDRGIGRRRCTSGSRS